jgi:hypothetical protein
MSLGFNLTGSLAAIDKWVQETHSDGDDDFDEVIVQEDVSHIKINSRSSGGHNHTADESAHDDGKDKVLDETNDSDNAVDEESRRFSAELLLSESHRCCTYSAYIHTYIYTHHMIALFRAIEKPDPFAATPPVDKEWLAARDSILSNGMVRNSVIHFPQLTSPVIVRLFCYNYQSPLSVPTTPAKLNAVRVVGTKALKAKRIPAQSPSKDDVSELDIFSPTRNAAMQEIKKKTKTSSKSSHQSIEVLPADTSVSAVDVREVEEISVQPEGDTDTFQLKYFINIIIIFNFGYIYVYSFWKRSLHERQGHRRNVAEAA